MAARSAHIVAPGAGAGIALGRQHHILAGDAEVAQRLAKHLLAAAGRIGIGGVEEVDPAVDGSLDYRVGLVLAGAADVPEDALAVAESHRAQAQRRDQQAGVPQRLVFHRDVLCGEGGHGCPVGDATRAG